MNARLSFGFSLAAAFICFIAASSVHGESFPSPGRGEKSSLLGLYAERSGSGGIGDRSVRVDLDGPERIRFQFDGEGWDVDWVRVEPGEYRLVPTEGAERDSGNDWIVDVPPESVVLAPFRLAINTGGAEPQRMDEGDRQRAGRDLALHVDYPAWSSRDLIGFGLVRPEIDPETIRYAVSITADPEDSEIFVDDVLAGAAPMEFSLPGGKHRILVRAGGYEDAVYYLRLQGDAVIDASLATAAEGPGIAEQEEYATLVSPFVSLGEADDQLARLFADTLLLTLEEDPRLEPIPSAAPWERRSALIHPDFLPMEETGADLMVSGFFVESGNGLTVQANLYDVQAETIRAAVTWTGRVGLDIFDAMDEIAADFAAEVDKVLPEAGRTLIRRQETIFPGTDEAGSRLSRKQLIRKRWRDSPDVFTFEIGSGGIFESYELEDGAMFSDVGKLNGPYLPVSFSWDRDLRPLFAVGAGAAFESTWTEQDYSGTGDHEGEWYWMVSAWGGPRLVFRSLRTDITMNLDLKVRFSPAVTYNWYDGGPLADEVGAMVYLDLPVKVGFRYYFNERADRTPIFISCGIGVTPVGFRIDLGGTGRTGFTGSNFLLNLGTGFRL